MNKTWKAVKFIWFSAFTIYWIVIPLIIPERYSTWFVVFMLLGNMIYAAFSLTELLDIYKKEDIKSKF